MNKLLESKIKYADGEMEQKEMSNFHGIVGVKNIGFNCFMNATIQALMAIEGLQELLLSDLEIEPDSPYTIAMNQIFREAFKYLEWD